VTRIRNIDVLNVPVHFIYLFWIIFKLQSAARTCKIAGPMFFKAAVNSEEHVHLIFTPFFRELLEVKMHSYFIQFNAVALATYF
jgi:hypothetical protein